MRDQAFVALQRLLPTLALTGLAHRLAASTHPRLSQWLIRQAIAAFAIDMEDAAEPDPAAYPSFNAFFTRALADGARPLAPEPALLCPVDGTISQLGAIRDGQLIQAKGREYSVAELLADPAAAKAYADGHFMTIYLAPANYHRIHMPLTATWHSAQYVPGRLLAVNPPTVRAARNLFARNERLVCHFQTAAEQPLCVVLVGALLVSGLETVATGAITPPHGGQARDWQWTPPHTLQRGAELGRFNYGSTVILLLPSRWNWAPALAPGQTVRMGQALGYPQ